MNHDEKTNILHLKMYKVVKKLYGVFTNQIYFYEYV
jgi:hypothetical protein